MSCDEARIGVVSWELDGEWEIDPDYKWIPFPAGQNMKTYVAQWLALHVAYNGWRKYVVAADQSILAINREFFPKLVRKDTAGEVYFCLFHACMVLLPEIHRQQVFEVRKIEQSGYALDIDVPYAYASTDFAHAKNWLLTDAKIPEAIVEIGINPDVIFHAIDADLIDWKAVFCTKEEERAARLAEVHGTMQSLIEESEFNGITRMDVFGEFAKVMKRLFGTSEAC